MIKINVTNLEQFRRKAESLSTFVDRVFEATVVRGKEIHKNIERIMPVLSRNLQSAVVLEIHPAERRVSIRLLGTGPYGTTDYFPCWKRTHKSIAEHTADEISHAKRRGVMSIQANPRAIPGGTTNYDKDPFFRSLANEGFTDIKVIESGPKGKQRTYDARPPVGWPFVRVNL